MSQRPLGACLQASEKTSRQATASSTDPLLRLIGPHAYPAWRRTLILLLTTLVPIAMVGAAAATSLGYEARPGKGSAPGTFARTLLQNVAVTGVNAVVHICFWCTLLFLVLERRGTSADESDRAITVAVATWRTVRGLRRARPNTHPTN